MTSFPLPSDGRGIKGEGKQRLTNTSIFLRLFPSPRPPPIRWERGNTLVCQTTNHSRSEQNASLSRFAARPRDERAPLENRCDQKTQQRAEQIVQQILLRIV